jgi:hypothetical protein
VPRVFLEAAIEGTQIHVQDACADLVFNLDAIGISEWEDEIEKKNNRSIGHETTKDFSWNSPQTEAHLSGNVYLGWW